MTANVRLLKKIMKFCEIINKLQHHVTIEDLTLADSIAGL